MEAHEPITQQHESSPEPAITTHPAYEACEQCGAPVDAAQRYCVECGARRKHVTDPAARFMSTATSRARAAARTQQVAGATGRSPRGVGLGLALAVALIPAGIGLGVVIGHSNTGPNDAALIAALKAQKQQVVNVGVGGGSAVSSGSSGSGSAGNGHGSKHAAAKTTASSSSASTSAAPSAVGYKASATSLKTGAAVVAKEQKTVGKSYVGSQQGLPSVVSVP
jgi:hypothetical protein